MVGPTGELKPAPRRGEPPRLPTRPDLTPAERGAGARLGSGRRGSNREATLACVTLADGKGPLELLGSWIEDARAAGAPMPRAVAFITAGVDGRPSARTVELKRIEDDALIFTSALWTRKAHEINANPNVALLFHWPSIGRQAHVAGTAKVAERELAVELYNERDLAHRLQTIVSRQGEPVEDLDALHARHSHLMGSTERPPDCPPDWGAIRVRPEAVELWQEAPDRIHERRLYQRTSAGWQSTLLAP